MPAGKVWTAWPGPVVVAAALMAVSMALVTGLALRRLLPPPTDAAQHAEEPTPGR